MHPSLRNVLIPIGLILVVKVLGTFAFVMPHSEPFRHRRSRVEPAEALTTWGSRLLASSSDNDEDDGWGEPPSKSDQERELAALQAERAGPPNSRSRVRQESEPPERDLFIPIFALVSLAGLFGSYGYEMLRLYSRGELYLPWDQ